MKDFLSLLWEIAAETPGEIKAFFVVWVGLMALPQLTSAPKDVRDGVSLLVCLVGSIPACLCAAMFRWERLWRDPRMPSLERLEQMIENRAQKRRPLGPDGCRDLYIDLLKRCAEVRELSRRL